METYTHGVFNINSISARFCNVLIPIFLDDLKSPPLVHFDCRDIHVDNGFKPNACVRRAEPIPRPCSSGATYKAFSSTELFVSLSSHGAEDISMILTSPITKLFSSHATQKLFPGADELSWLL